MRTTLFLALFVLPLFLQAQPSNDECLNAIALTIGTATATSVTTDDLTTATESAEALPPCFTFTSNYDYLDVWYDVTTSSSGNLRIFNANFKDYFALYDACGGNLITDACFSDDNFVYDLAAGNYKLRVARRDINASVVSFDLQTYIEPSNDDCASPIIISVGTASPVSVSTDHLAGASQSAETLPPCFTFTSNYQYLDVWYEINTTASGNLRFSNANFNDNFALYDACGGNLLTDACFSDDNIIYDLPVGSYKLRVARRNINVAIVSFDLQLYLKPVNDECINATSVSVGTVAAITIVSPHFAGASESSEMLPPCYSFTSNYKYLDIWYDLTTSATGNLRFTGADFNDYFSLYDGCGGNLLTDACFSDDGFIYSLAAGNYKLRVARRHINVGATSFDLQIFPEPSNDDCTNPTSLSPTTTSPIMVSVTAQQCIGASQSIETLPACFTFAANYQYHDLWYTVDMPVDGSLFVQGSSVSTYVALYNSCGAALINCFANNGQFDNLTQGSSYIMRVAKRDFNSAAYSFDLIAQEVPFAIADLRDGSCYGALPVDISTVAGNTEIWVPLINNTGQIMAAVNANGQDLGEVEASYLISTDDVQTYLSEPYLRRNLSLTSANIFASPISVRVYLSADEINDLALVDPTVSSISDLKIKKAAHSCADGYDSSGAVIIPTDVVYGADYFLEMDVSELSTFYGVSSQILPVALSSFNAKAAGRVNTLSWETASEENTDRFEIQRTIAHNSGWENIGKIRAIGFTAYSESYSFDDPDPIAISYYRLKIVDIDGRFEYSDVVKVRRQVAIPKVKIYPNPVDDVFVIENLNDSTVQEITLHDLEGQYLKTLMMHSDQRVDLTGLSAGLYLVKITSQYGTEVLKLVKQ